VEWNLQQAFELCEAWRRPDADLRGDSGLASVWAGIEAIDDLISRYLALIYRDPALHDLECTCESIYRLLPEVKLDVLPFSWKAYANTEDEERREALSNKLGYGNPFLAPNPNTILIMEVTEPGQNEVDIIRVLLELDPGKSTVVLLGLRSGRDADLQSR
jgi:hypothetical protein